MTEDPRKTALKRGLNQLRPHELHQLLEHVCSNKPILLDRDEDGNANWNGQAYCPLAIGVGLHKGLPWASDKSVYDMLSCWFGLVVYNTRGVVGEFFTADRRRDLEIALREVIVEREALIELYREPEESEKYCTDCGSKIEGYHGACTGIGTDE